MNGPEDSCNVDGGAPVRQSAGLVKRLGAAIEQHRSEDALELIARVCSVATDAAENEVPGLHLAIRFEAEECEAASNWAGAERAYWRALEIAGDNPQWTYRGHDELRRLFVFRGRLGDALQEARAAVEAGRVTTGILHAQALICQALVHLRLGQARDASDLVNRSFAVHEADRLSDWMRARALAVRARCKVELEDDEAARVDLDAAWRLLEPLSVIAGLPGVQAAFGEWWQAEAGRRSRLGDAYGCVKAWREVVISRRWNATQPQIAGPYVQSALADALESLAHAQEMAGTRLAGAASLAESRSVRHEIEHPAVPEA